MERRCARKGTLASDLLRGPIGESCKWEVALLPDLVGERLPWFQPSAARLLQTPPYYQLPEVTFGSFGFLVL